MTLRFSSTWDYQILKNEIDEDFKDLQKQVKSTFKDILSAYIEKENSKKTKEAINALIEEKTKGKISKTFAKSLINTIFFDDNPSKSEIIDFIDGYVSQEAPPKKTYPNQRSQRVS